MRGVMARTVTVSMFNAFDRLVSVAVGDPAIAGSVATTTYAHDRLGRVALMTRTVGGGEPDLVQSYGYDADGNQTVAAYGVDAGDTDGPSGR